jgi:hypothetical protein
MNEKILNFIQDLELTDFHKAEITKKLHEIFTRNKVIKEKFIYGGIGMYIKEKLIGGIYASKKHISLVFSRGNELSDKYNILEGEGKFRRHIKLTSTKDVELKHCRFYIQQIINLESSK